MIKDLLEQNAVQPNMQLLDDFGEFNVSQYDDKSLGRVSLTAALADQSEFENSKPLDQGTEFYKEKFKKGDEEQVRNSFGESRKREEVNDVEREVETLISSQRMEPELLQRTLDFVEQTRNKPPSRYAMEKAAVDRIIEMGQTDVTQAILEKERYQKGTTLDSVRRFVTLNEGIQNLIGKYGEDLKQASTLDKVGSFITQMLPFFHSSATSGNVENTKGSGIDAERMAFIRSGNPEVTLGALEENLKNGTALGTLLGLEPDTFDKMSEFIEDEGGFANIIPNPTEIMAGLFGTNEQLAIESLRNLQEFTKNDELERKIWLGVDLATVVSPVALANIAKSPLKTMSALGARKNAAETAAVTITDTVQASNSPLSSIVSTSDAIEAAIPSQFKTVGLIDDAPVELAGDISKQIDKNKAIVDRLAETNISDAIVDPNAFKEAAKEVEERVIERFGSDRIADVHTFRSTDDNVLGTLVTEVTIGRKNGGGYATESAAKAGATRIGYKGTPYQDINGQWYTKIRQRANDLGFAPDIDTDNLTSANLLSKNVRNPRGYGEQISIEKGAVAGFNASAINANIIQPLAEPIAKLSSKSKRQLETVLSRSLNDEKWFGIDELVGEMTVAKGGLAPTSEEIRAYYSYKNLSDMDWFLRANVEQKRMLSRNIEVFESKNSPFLQGEHLGREVENLDVAANRLYDITDNKHFPRGTFSKESLDEILQSQDKTIIKLNKTVETDVGPVDNIIVPKSDLKRRSVELEDSLNYRAGGHVLYEDGSHFVKQARTGTYSDTGQTFKLPDATFVASRNSKRAQEWADKMNEAVDEFKAVTNGTKAAEDINAEVFAKTKYETFENFARAVETNKINTDHKFEVTVDRGTTLASEENSNIRHFLGEEVSPLHSFYSTQGRAFVGRRGERLLGPDDETAQILSPFESMGRSISNIYDRVATFNFFSQQSERWVRAASKFLDDSTVRPNASHEEIFLNAKLREVGKGIDQKTINKLQQQRDKIKQISRFPTKEAVEINRIANRLFDWSSGKLDDAEEYIGHSAKLGDKIFDAKNLSIPNMWKSLAFNIKLGLFDVSQLLVQSQTAMMMSAMQPTRGVKAWNGYRATRHAVDNFTDKEALNAIAKSGFHGMEPDDFKDFVGELHRSGFDKLGGEQVYLDFYNSQPFSRTAIKEASEKQRMFFIGVERFNRIAAYRMAWEEGLEKLGKKALKTSEGRGFVMNKAIAYSGEMVNQSKARMQRGLMSIPTQFMSHDISMIQNILPKALGGNIQFSPKQKASLLLYSTIAYGGAGMPFGKEVLDYIGEETDMTPEAYTNFYQGMFDSLISASLGEDTEIQLFSSRGGLGTGLSQLVSDVFDKSDPKGLVDLAGGPAWSIGTDFISSMRTAMHMLGTQLSEPTEGDWDALLEVATEDIASVQRLIDGLKALDMGYYTTRSGARVEGVSKGEAFMRMVGAVPIERDLQFKQFKDRKSILDSRSYKEYVRLMSLDFMDTIENPENYLTNPAKRGKMKVWVDAVRSKWGDDIAVQAQKDMLRLINVSDKGKWIERIKGGREKLPNKVIIDLYKKELESGRVQ